MSVDYQINCQAKEFRMLQMVAFECGYRWEINRQKVSHCKCEYLVFTRNMLIFNSTRGGGYKEVTSQEMFQLFCQDNDIFIGDSKIVFDDLNNRLTTCDINVTYKLFREIYEKAINQNFDWLSI